MRAPWLVLGLALLSGCIRYESANAPPVPAPGTTGSTVNLRGTILHKPWSKSGESWRAGGSDHYVLDVGDDRTVQRTAKEGVILRPMDAAMRARLAELVGKAVVVSGNYVDDKPAKQLDPGMQYPVGADGAPKPSGGGFEIESLQPLP